MCAQILPQIISQVQLHFFLLMVITIFFILHYYRVFFYRSALKNDQVSDYVVNPIKKVLSVRIS